MAKSLLNKCAKYDQFWMPSIPSAGDGASIMPLAKGPRPEVWRQWFVDWWVGVTNTSNSMISNMYIRKYTYMILYTMFIAYSHVVYIFVCVPTVLISRSSLFCGKHVKYWSVWQNILYHLPHLDPKLVGQFSCCRSLRASWQSHRNGHVQVRLNIHVNASVVHCTQERL